MSNIYGKYNLPVRFDGDIIITDPCYIMKEQNWDWKDCPSWWDYVSKVTTEEVYREDGTHYTRYNPPTPEMYPDCRPKQLSDYDDDEHGKLMFELDVLLRPEKPRMHSDMLKAEYEAHRKAEEEWRKTHKRDWEICEYGERMDKLGITTSLIASTLYGDWGCTTFNSDTKEMIGQFCADAGLVGVFYLDEVLKYNPNYNDHLGKSENTGLPWPVTVIRDFHGEVMLETRQAEKIRKYPDNIPNGYDDECRVVGTGNINFIGTQTSL